MMTKLFFGNQTNHQSSYRRITYRTFTGLVLAILLLGFGVPAQERRGKAVSYGSLSDQITLGQNSVVVILAMNSRTILGGVRNGKFVGVKTALSDFRVGEKYRLFRVGSDNLTQTYITKKIESDFQGYYFDGEAGEDLSGIALSPNVGWNPTPRETKVLSPENKTYQAVVRNILRAKGIKKPDVQIKQLLRVDLEGDGRDEVFIYARNDNHRLSPRAGTYSILILRKVVHGQVRNILVKSEIHRVASRRMMWQNPTYEITSVLDLDGDGKMEFVVYETNYEYAGTTVYQLDNGKAVEVLEAAWGA